MPQLLMTDFCNHLWDPESRYSRLEALRQAQLKMLLDGASRGLEIADQPADAKKPMPPFYWAAFELSSVWR